MRCTRVAAAYLVSIFGMVGKSSSLTPYVCSHCQRKYMQFSMSLEVFKLKVVRCNKLRIKVRSPQQVNKNFFIFLYFFLTVQAVILDPGVCNLS